MKTLIVSAMLATPFISNAQNYTEQQSLNRIVKTMKALETKGDEIWPGWRFNGPMIFHFPKGGIHAFQLPSSNPAWEMRNDYGLPSLYSKADHWDIRSKYFVTNHPVDGEPSFVFRMRDPGTYRYIYVMTHERFHKFQDRWNFRSPKQYDAYRDVTNVGLAFLESHILEKYLTTLNEQYFYEYYAIQRKRFEQMDPESAYWEKWQVSQEGLATYAGYTTYRVIKSLEGFDAFQAMIDDAVKLLQVRNLKSIVKRRTYAVGTAIALYLERAKVKGWKESVNNGNHLMDVLKNELPLPSQAINALYQHVLEKYDVDKFIELARKEIKAHDNLVSDVWKRYEETPGTEIVFRFNSQSNCTGGGRTNPSHYLPTGDVLSENVSIELRCYKGRFDFASYKIPFLMNLKASRVFKESDHLKITIDGRAIELKALVDSNDCTEGCQISEITWKGDQSRFKFNGNAQIVTANGHLELNMK